MTRDDLLVCPNPVETGMLDDRHVCDSVPDYDRPMLDPDDNVCYPIRLLIYRCAGCGVGLIAVPGDGRWGVYLIEEEPW